VDHEAHLPAEQSTPRAYAWIPCAHGNQGRPPRPRSSPCEGSQETHTLKFTDLNLVPAGRERLTHSKERRLRSKREFDAVYANGRRFGNGFFGLTVRANDKGCPRLGLAVAVKTAGNAVERNRIRRLIRESFRLHQRELPAFDFVVSARLRARGVVSAQLRAQLEPLWQEVRTKCGS
jgi:ribonuclease P protein component